MIRTKYLFRACFFLLAVILLIRLNSTTADNAQTIAEFKFKTIEKFRADSLDTKHKLDMVLRETTRFVEGSSHVRDELHYLMGLLGLFGIFEVFFLIREKRNPGQKR